MFRHVTTILEPSDDAAYQHVLEIISARYGGELYHPIQQEGRGDVEVLVTAPHVRPIQVIDARGHLVLHQKMCEAFSTAAVEHGMWQVDKAGDLSELNPKASIYPQKRTMPDLKRLWYGLDADAQVRLFHSFVEEIPEFIRRLFPIAPPELRFSIELGSLELVAPRSAAVSMRWRVRGRLFLVNRSTGEGIDSDDFVLCGFDDCGPEGRTVTPRFDTARPFDEESYFFRRNTQRWLRQQVPESMRRHAGNGHVSIRGILQCVPDNCPICKKEVQQADVAPREIAYCAECGHIFWVDPALEPSDAYAQALFEFARKQMERGQALLAQCSLAALVRQNPDNVAYRQSLQEAVRQQHPNWYQPSPLADMFRTETMRTVAKAKREGDWEAVQDVLEDGVTREPWDGLLHVELGHCCRLRGFRKAAIYAYQCALEIMPDRSDIRKLIQELAAES
jgi:hypothetical protein